MSNLSKALEKPVNTISDGLEQVPSQQLTFNHLRTRNVIRCEMAFHAVHSWSPTDWATAMAGECGEACNMVKKLRRLDDGKQLANIPPDRADIINAIGDEIADCEG